MAAERQHQHSRDRPTGFDGNDNSEEVETATVSHHSSHHITQQRTLIIDNYDSFTYNLVHAVATVNIQQHVTTTTTTTTTATSTATTTTMGITGRSSSSWCDCDWCVQPWVVYNDTPWTVIQQLLPYIDNLIISPGPGRPDNDQDLGVSKQILLTAPKPVLGFSVIRYNSLLADPGTIPDCLQLTAWSYTEREQLDPVSGCQLVTLLQHVPIATGTEAQLAECANSNAIKGILEVQGLRHKKLPITSVQFHPESICSTYGLTLISNWMQCCTVTRTKPLHSELPHHLAKYLTNPIKIPPPHPASSVAGRLHDTSMPGPTGAAASSSPNTKLSGTNSLPAHGLPIAAIAVANAVADTSSSSNSCSRNITAVPATPPSAPVPVALHPILKFLNISPTHSYTLLATKVDRTTFPSSESVFTALFSVPGSVSDSPCNDVWWLDSAKVEAGISRFSFMGDGRGPLSFRLAYSTGKRQMDVTIDAARDTDSKHERESECPGGAKTYTHKLTATEDMFELIQSLLDVHKYDTMQWFTPEPPPPQPPPPPPPPPRPTPASSSSPAIVASSAQTVPLEPGPPAGNDNESQTSSPTGVVLPFDFAGGLVGYLGYEMKDECQPVKKVTGKFEPVHVDGDGEPVTAVQLAQSISHVTTSNITTSCANAVDNSDRGPWSSVGIVAGTSAAANPIPAAISRDGIMVAVPPSPPDAPPRLRATSYYSYSDESGIGACVRSAASSFSSCSSGTRTTRFCSRTSSFSTADRKRVSVPFLSPTRVNVPVTTPDAVFTFADRFIAFDHLERVCYVVCVSRDEDDDPLALASSKEWVTRTVHSLLAINLHLSQTHVKTDTLPLGPLTTTSPAPASSSALSPVIVRSSSISGDGSGTNKCDCGVIANGITSSGAIAHDVECMYSGMQLRDNRDQYLANVMSCQQQIRDGESYELCLTTQVWIPYKVRDPYCLYRLLRNSNPAPYAAFLRFTNINANVPGIRSSPSSNTTSNDSVNLNVISSSPERFIKIDKQRWVESKPIKGTVPRGSNPEEDERLKRQLQSTVKDFAENLMIVDLIRNDLGRVCCSGTVSVPKLMHVETYATVHQLVTTVCGRVQPTVPATQVVKTAFPPGSMTGAPKLRSCEILSVLEIGRRGIYSGCIGFLSVNGTADFNVVIRTAVCTSPATAMVGVAEASGSTGASSSPSPSPSPSPSAVYGLSVGAGGAIIHMSDEVEEFEEMKLKTRAVLKAIHQYIQTETNSELQTESGAETSSS